MQGIAKNYMWAPLQVFQTDMAPRNGKGFTVTTQENGASTTQSRLTRAPSKFIIFFWAAQTKIIVDQWICDFGILGAKQIIKQEFIQFVIELWIEEKK